MTGPARVVADGAPCWLLADADYAPEVVRLVRKARRRVFASIFIIDPQGAVNPFLDLLNALKDATWLGVDVRIIAGGSRSTFDIAVASAAGRAVLRDSGVQCRWLTGLPVRSSHAKFVVADDVFVLGSHNWSAGAFTDQIQDSIAVHSASIAGVLAARFERQWATAGGAP
ncbi:hypothetical protein ADK67_03700 [Saccharothrix sp. NRRL B-16348]|uniref:phospholipase D-like domain-containing protein n=1 Tax=Saccharothrix sp. NRRL B-16348 TaxID=1415542 RepID=UPI0006AEC540|nr:phospholipase D-like domain-containing protein [Saccharothrix sp. NRRL B-16348]KOX34388.1 hypothetical protein ADK67_03700 [Saccharothrix sp. NRRL B-16348]